MTFRILQQDYWPVDRFKPAAYNPRTITKEERARLKRGILAFGCPDPLIARVEDGLGIGGHQRFEVLSEIIASKDLNSLDDLKWLAERNLPEGQIPVVAVEGLTDEQAATLNVLLNNPNAQGSFDPAKLAEVVSQIDGHGFDATLSGFDAREIEKMVTFTGSDKRKDDDFNPEPPEQPVTETGQVIELGPHLLICSPAEIPEAWELVLGKERADMVFTDPPYNLDYEGRTRRKLKIENDALSDDELHKLLHRAFSLAVAYCEPSAPWYVCAPTSPESFPVASVLRELGIWRQTLAWVKDSLVMARTDYHYRHEHIYYGWLPGGPRHFFCGNRTLDTVWEVARPKRSEEHPTMKPVALAQKAIEYSSRPGAIVVDMFAGSGTTMIACEQTGRVAVLFEKSPAYCDVIRRRWTQYTRQGRLALAAGG